MSRIVLRTRFLIPAVALACVAGLRADEPADRAALHSILDRYEKAVSSGETGALETFFTPDTTGVLVTDRDVGSYAAFADYYAKIREMIGPGGSYRVKPAVDKTELFGDIAVSRGTTGDTVTTGDGREFRFRSHWTAVCRKTGGEWKILRFHASMDPLENAFVAERAKVAGRLCFSGGLAAGILCSVAAVFALRRRRKKTA